jgi:hypothetical protein
MEFPELTELGKQEAERLVEQFKKRLKSAAEEVLGKLYCDVLIHIETDSWTNYREAIRLEMQRQWFSDHKHLLHSEEAWASEIRKAFYTQFKDELTDARVRDLEAEVKKLNGWLHERRY